MGRSKQAGQGQKRNANEMTRDGSLESFGGPRGQDKTVLSTFMGELSKRGGAQPAS